MEKSKISEWELHGNIGVLTLSNPPQNYLVEPEFVDMSDLKRWTDNDSLKGIIIRGKGRHFCAGFDKEEIFKITDKSVLRDALRRSEKTLYYLEDLPVPVVGAITGVCFGAGLELVLSCDIRVCSEKSLLSFPETEFGLIPGFNGTIRLPKRLGIGYPMELILSAKTIHADEALQNGIVDYLVPSKEVFDFSLNLLEKYTATTPVNVLHAAMKAVNNARKLPKDAASKEETSLVAGLVLEKLKNAAE
ncbi:MAG: enoyl-CoA hydratase/isomerase family protein [Nitrospirota bacterium]